MRSDSHDERSEESYEGAKRPSPSVPLEQVAGRGVNGVQRRDLLLEPE